MGSPASGSSPAVQAGGEQPAPRSPQAAPGPQLGRGWETTGEAMRVGLCGAKRLCCGLQEQKLPPVLPRAGQDLIAASSEFPCTVWV